MASHKQIQALQAEVCTVSNPSCCIVSRICSPVNKLNLGKKEKGGEGEKGEPDLTPLNPALRSL